MRPPEQVKLDLVRQWLAKADNDLETAKFLFASGRPFFSAICFHSQQAAEKYFKALLTWHQIEFPKTHDLELLLGLIASTDSALASSLTEVACSIPMGWKFAIPGMFRRRPGKMLKKQFDLQIKCRKRSSWR